MGGMHINSISKNDFLKIIHTFLCVYWHYVFIQIIFQILRNNALFWNSIICHGILLKIRTVYFGYMSENSIIDDGELMLFHDR